MSLERFTVVELADGDAVGARAAELFLAIGAEAQRARGTFTVALAGGSTPAAMHKALREAPSHEFNWGSVDVFFGDERAVAPDSPLSNFGNARAQLLDQVPLARVHPMPAWSDDLDAGATAYERALRDACGDDGALDLLVMGVGEDAHILSLFPGCPLIDEDGGALVAALHDPPMNPAVSRITLTPTALRRAHNVLVLLVGAKKREARRALSSASVTASSAPVLLLDTRLALTRGREATVLLLDHASRP
ncbi:MAG: 6-phosphogluconolactonase [Myxococcales bacterium]|nr:6-phosphogluconolactonase [Myxococcales bacterium]